jgi:hypothetical protein
MILIKPSYSIEVITPDALGLIERAGVLVINQRVSTQKKQQRSLLRCF